MVDVSGKPQDETSGQRHRLLALMVAPEPLVVASRGSAESEIKGDGLGSYAALRARQGRALERVLEFVIRHPGAHKAAICSGTGFDPGTVSKHLAALQRREEIHLRRLAGRVLAFPASYSAIELQALPALHQGLGPRLAIELVKTRGRHVAQLAAQLGVATKTVVAHLAAYQRHGLAVPDASGKWHATALLRRLMDK